MASLLPRRLSQLPITRWLRLLPDRMLSGARMLRIVIPGLVYSGDQRAILREMVAFSNQLPVRLQSPLVETLAELTTVSEQARLDLCNEDIIRNLADFAVHINRQTMLGFCLQRSLIRYCFLRRMGLPVELQFGASPGNLEQPLQLTGHAWLTLKGEPYYESGENWRGYVVMLSFPTGD